VSSDRSGDALAELLGRIESSRGDHERLLAELWASEKRFRALARRVWQVQEEERRRLARELHDGLGQMLTALKNELDRLAAATFDPKTAQGLASSAALAAEALASTRELSRLLRPSMLDDLGLEPSLRWLARTLGERTGFAVELDLPGDGGERLPPELETLLFRVAQEALTNALKHSGAAGAKLELARRRRGIVLVVRDEGRGCEPAEVLAASESARGLGLRSMRDRVELHGGRFELESKPGAGTRIAVEVPFGQRREER